MKNGVLDDVLKLMNASGTKYTRQEKVTILSFDEMKVDESIEYEKSDDKLQILEPLFILSEISFDHLIIISFFLDCWILQTNASCDGKRSVCEMEAVCVCK